MQNCTKIIFGNTTSPRIILGLILKEDDNFIHFQTEHNKLIIGKKSILSIEETDQEFRGDIE